MPKKTTVPGSLENVFCPQCNDYIGFKFGIRLPRYRGNLVSLINGCYVSVDGEEYPQEAMRFIINGKPPRTWEQLKEAVWEHWNYQDIGYIFVQKPGGLAKGEHTVVAVLSNFEQYGYNPMTDQKRVDEVTVPTAGGSHMGVTTVPMVQVIE